MKKMELLHMKLIYDARGNLAKPTGSETLDQKVIVSSGSQQGLFLEVNSDDYAREVGRRFSLYDFMPYVTAPVVVGVVDSAALMKKGKEALARLERNMPK